MLEYTAIYVPMAFIPPEAVVSDEFFKGLDRIPLEDTHCTRKRILKQELLEQAAKVTDVVLLFSTLLCRTKWHCYMNAMKSKA